MISFFFFFLFKSTSAMPVSVQSWVLLNETTPCSPSLRVYVCVFLAHCLLRDANRDRAPSPSERAGAEWLVSFPSPARQCRAFFSAECGFSRGRVPFPAEFVFPLSHFSHPSPGSTKATQASPALAGLSLRITEPLGLNPRDSKHCDPVPLRRLAFDSCCQQ